MLKRTLIGVITPNFKSDCMNSTITAKTLISVVGRGVIFSEIERLRDLLRRKIWALQS
jgi:hypothetical protein